jgi:hypothetical protein
MRAGVDGVRVSFAQIEEPGLEASSGDEQMQDRLHRAAAWWDLSARQWLGRAALIML